MSKLHSLLFSFLLLAAVTAPSAYTQEIKEMASVEVSPKLREYAIRSTKHLAKVFDLDRWIVLLEWDTLPPEVSARVRGDFNYRYILMELDPGHLEPSYKEVCRVILHELLHIKLAPLARALFYVLKDPVDLEQARNIEESVTTDLERSLWDVLC